MFIDYLPGHKPLEMDTLQTQVLRQFLQTDGNDLKGYQFLPLVHALSEIIDEVHGSFIETKMLIHAQCINIISSGDVNIMAPTETVKREI